MDIKKSAKTGGFHHTKTLEGVVITTTSGIVDGVELCEDDTLDNFRGRRPRTWRSSSRCAELVGHVYAGLDAVLDLGDTRREYLGEVLGHVLVLDGSPERGEHLASELRARVDRAASGRLS